jgi:hypothetical protein
MYLVRHRFVHRIGVGKERPVSRQVGNYPGALAFPVVSLSLIGHPFLSTSAWILFVTASGTRSGPPFCQ